MEEDVYVTKNNFILHSRDNKKSLRCRWKKTTFSTDQFSRFLATSNSLVEKCFNSIFVDGVHCSMEKKETITGLLRDHIFGQVVVASGNNGQRYLLQRDGIPQVSIDMYCLEKFIWLPNHWFCLLLLSLFPVFYVTTLLGKYSIVNVLQYLLW